MEAAILPYRDTGAIIAFDTAAAPRYADILAMRERAGLPIATGGAQIAAICRAHDATCATRNINNFVHTGVALIDPWSGEERPPSLVMALSVGTRRSCTSTCN